MTSPRVEIDTSSTDDQRVDRREVERNPIECQAQLHLTTGIRFGSLRDLSPKGARVVLGNPPRIGTDALLKWQSHEAFCKVIWADDEACGLAFDRMLSREMLDDSLSPSQDTAKPNGPVAAVSSIPLGRRRSRL
jgi:hypothetical protein